MPRMSNPVGPVGRRFARLVAVRRADLGLTKAELARRATDLGRPMSHDVVTKIENADRHVDVDDLSALLGALRMSWTPNLLDVTACDQCQDGPPSGFTCNRCGTSG